MVLVTNTPKQVETRSPASLHLLVYLGREDAPPPKEAKDPDDPNNTCEHLLCCWLPMGRPAIPH